MMIHQSVSITRVLILCGDRHWVARTPILRLLQSLPLNGRTVVITGGARGADDIGWVAARQNGHRTVRMDAPWSVYDRRAGAMRNQWMLEMLIGFKTLYPDAVCDVHAFHEHLAASKGTSDMLMRARLANIPYTIHSEADPDPELQPDE